MRASRRFPALVLAAAAPMTDAAALNCGVAKSPSEIAKATLDLRRWSFGLDAATVT